MLQQGVQVPEYFLPGVCRAIKLSPSQTVAVCFALMHSQYRSLVQEGLRLLKLKLPEITTVADIGEEIVQALLHFAVNNEVCRCYYYIDHIIVNQFFLCRQCAQVKKL